MRKNGSFLGQEDLGAACGKPWCQKLRADSLTLTYDCRTIPTLLKNWAEEGRQHGGVIFVDEKTISQADIGGLIQSLDKLVKEARDLDWIDRIYFLRR